MSGRGGAGQEDVLRNRVATVWAEVLDARCEADRLELLVLPDLRAEAAMRTGGWEVWRDLAEYSADHAGLVLEDCRLQVASDREPSVRKAMAESDARLRERYHELREAYDGYLADLLWHLERTSSAGTDDEELTNLYREVVRRVSPHPGYRTTPGETASLGIARRAYARRDVGVLVSLEAATRAAVRRDLTWSNVQELAALLAVAEREVLRAREALAGARRKVRAAEVRLAAGAQGEGMVQSLTREARAHEEREQAYRQAIRDLASVPAAAEGAAVLLECKAATDTTESAR